MENLTDENSNETTCALSTSNLDAPPPEISMALQVLSGKWTLIILCQLAKRTARFNELKKTIPGITQHMLTSSLRVLEANHLVQRTVYAEVPPRVEYQLTQHGRSLKPLIEALAVWGRHHIEHRKKFGPQLF
jgi:DNA-binding HxlR family transcriptional regulator